MRQSTLLLALIGTGILAGCGGSGSGPGDTSSIYFVNNVTSLQRIGLPSGTTDNLFTGAGALSEVKISPDETKVLFRFGSDLRIANMDGTGVTTILGYKSADWNSDGTKIYAISTDNIVRTMNPDLTAVSANIYDGNAGGGIWQIDVSADGTKIALIAYPSNAGQLRTMDADGTDVQTLTPPGGDDALAPRWSPDKSRIVFDDGEDVFVINADGTGRITLAGTSAVEANPVYLPDGTIAYVNEGDLWTMSATGTNKTEILDTVAAIAWPDAP